MQRRPASDCVRIARANIRLAAKACEAADMACLQQALDFLETAATEMRQAEAEVQGGKSTDTAGPLAGRHIASGAAASLKREATRAERATEDLRRETALLKREVAGLMCVIDASAALCRGLSVRLGCTAPAYTSEGCAVSAPAPAAACEMQA
jgi:hypothetical protein